MNFTIYSGDSRDLIVYVTDSNNNFINITGFIIEFALVNNDNSQIILTKDNDLGIIITDAVNGKFIVNLLSTDTVNLSGEYKYSTRLTDTSGNTSIILTGIMKVEKSLI